MRSLVLSMLMLVITVPLAARAEVVIKLGTVAPENSPWHKKLKELGDTWEKESNGQVKLKIYPGGVAGDESDMIRKMRVGQLQAGAMTFLGLRDVDPYVQAMLTPGMFATEAEVQCTMDKVTPTFEKKLAAAGFTVLTWADTGWVYIFSARELKTPSDIKGAKIFTWAGDPGATTAWRKAGFQPVVLSVNDVTTSLATGMIDTFSVSPIVAFTTRWYERCKFMTNSPWARLLGAIVVSQEAWNKVPVELRPKLLEAAKKGGGEINQAVVRMGAASIKAMEKNGLKVVEPSDEEKKEWTKLAEASWPTLKGQMFPAEAFDQVKKARDECRAGK